MADDKKFVLRPDFVKCNSCTIVVNRKASTTEQDWDEFSVEFTVSHAKSCWDGDEKR
jgi:hypothetical protein